MTRHDPTDATDDGRTDTDAPTDGPTPERPTGDRPETSHDRCEGTVYVHELTANGLPTPDGWIGMDAEHTIDAEAHR